MFTRLYRECIDSKAVFEYKGMLHRAGALYDASDFQDGVNAIVDFKYSTSPRVTWWFDHHESAFMTEEDRAHFEKITGSSDTASAARTMFYDPTYKSCTKLLATVGESHFGMNLQPVAELVHWADIIDGAAYKSAEFAVGLSEPAMKITMVLEATTEPGFAPKLIPLLATLPLDEVLAHPLIATRLQPLLDRHQRSIEILRKTSVCEEGTIFFDVSEYDLEGYNKFVPYYLHPESIYSVGLSRSSFRVKVSVGSNPWAKAENMTNLAKICERYGGGGHSKVGAISFPPDAWEEAKKASDEIVRELREYAKAHHNR
jgi:hypothetical protein